MDAKPPDLHTQTAAGIPPGLNSAESTDKKSGASTAFAFSAIFVVVLIVLDLVLVVL